ncbi:MAG: hypothetical protein MI921_08940 [Cytophagales bacterium]|nr:hypothetical protein [Cytophagales bacterium]
MEEKNLMKEILYLGTGLTAQGLNKMKSIVEHFSEAMQMPGVLTVLLPRVDYNEIKRLKREIMVT